MWSEVWLSFVERGVLTGLGSFSSQLLLDHQDAIASEHNDPIHELLEDLGEVPTIEALIGEKRMGPGVD